MDCAQSALKELEGHHKNTEINWDAILMVQYRAALKSPRTIIDVGAHTSSPAEYA
jgi:hypothetical protein